MDQHNQTENAFFKYQGGEYLLQQINGQIQQQRH